MSYVKLSSSILDSTVWAEPVATRIVWITMLAMADRDGIVEARAPGIARAAGVTRAEVDAALACFSSPDPDSRTPDNDGRRAEECDEGWRLLNYEKYRERSSIEERRAKDAERQARKRNRDKLKESRQKPECHAQSRDVTRVTTSEAAAAASSSANPNASPDAESRESAGAREGAPLEWHEVLTLWNDATQTMHNPDPSARQACNRIALTQTPADIRKAAAAAKRDGWARDNGAHVTHFEKSFTRYLADAKGTRRKGGKSGPAPATAYDDYKAEPMGRFTDG